MSDRNIFHDHSSCCGSDTRVFSSPAIDWTQRHHFALIKDGPRKAIGIDGILFLLLRGVALHIVLISFSGA